MAVHEILKLPDKRLRLLSEPVKQIDASIRKLIDDMFETMYKAPGIGLAAIQVGVAKRVITLDPSKKEGDHKPRVYRTTAAVPLLREGVAVGTPVRPKPPRRAALESTRLLPIFAVVLLGSDQGWRAAGQRRDPASTWQRIESAGSRYPWSGATATYVREER
jgi:hypothetical protein